MNLYVKAEQEKIFTYISLVPIVIQSLNEHGDTEEDGMQKAEDSGGGSFPRVTIQPSAT